MRIGGWSSDVCSSVHARIAVEIGGKAAARDPFGLRMAKHAGIFGQPRLVVMGAEHQLDHRSHRRARLRLQPRVVQKLGQGLGLRFGGEREVPRPPDSLIERSEERRVGKEWESTCRYRGWAYH